jgi:transglutaminase-like putative cysteine protease
MTFDTYFRTTSYALVGTAFLALSLTGELDAVSILLYGTVFCFAFFADTKGWMRLRLREWMWRVLALVYVPFLFLDGFLTSRILALVHMTLFLSAVKLFQDKRDRDWIFLYLIAFFQMLLAAGMTFDSTFIASLGLFLFCFVSTLAAFEIRISRREVNPIDEEVIGRPGKHNGSRSQGASAVANARNTANRSPLAGRVRYLVGASVVQVCMVAVLTLPFFFLIPRFGGAVTRGLGDVEALTGFSESVKLGDVASIKENQQVVMRVKLDHRPSKYIRWRGIALDRYSGDTWSRSPSQLKIHEQNKRSYNDQTGQDSVFERDYTIAERSGNRELLTQRVVVEPSITQTIFAAQTLIRLRGDIPQIAQDVRSGAVWARGVRGRLQYTALSDVGMPDEKELREDLSTSYTDDVAGCLQLPDDVGDQIRLDSRIKQLALAKTRGARTPYEKARAIETYLKTEFGYTLDLTPSKRDPLAEFLFDAKAGHCEYFATAMAVMMRMIGIPARVVNGFQMGEFNDVNGLYTVRASDAHSWVEVYFADSRKWIEFDPTPAAGINDYSQGGWLAQLRKYIEAAEVFWLDYVVTLDSQEQSSIMAELQHRLLDLKDRAVSYYKVVKNWFRSAANSILDRDWDLADILRLLAMVAAAVAACGGFYVGVAYLRRRHREPTGYGPWWHRLLVLPRWRSSRHAERDPRGSAVLFYQQMLAIAARSGWIKSPDQTPLEFAAASGLPQISEITSVYNRVRFGGALLDDGEARKVADLLDELKRENKRQPSIKKQKKSKKSRRTRLS